MTIASVPVPLHFCVAVLLLVCFYCLERLAARQPQAEKHDIVMTPLLLCLLCSLLVSSDALRQNELADNGSSSTTPVKPQPRLHGIPLAPFLPLALTAILAVWWLQRCGPISNFWFLV